MTVLNIFDSATPVESFAAGATIFEEGAPSGTMRVVRTGEVNVLVNGAVVETVGPGGVIGEMALIDGSDRSATVVAHTDCSLISVDPEHFQRLVRQNPAFALTIMRIMADRLRRMDSRAGRG